METPTIADYKYKAFISYSHAADHKLASALQSALQSFARPYYLSRAMLVFRDKTELSANPALWPTIQKALSESEYFVLLASPRAAKSRWVKREIDYWLQIHNDSIDNFLVVWTDGVLPWNTDTGAIDWSGATALPAEVDWKQEGSSRVRLPEILIEEPLYLDFRELKHIPDLSLRDTRFLDQIATLAATLQKRRKSELIGEDASRLRRYRRIRTGVIALLSVLLLVATGAAIFARKQSNTAQAALASETEARRLEQEALKAERIAKQDAENRRKEAEEARDRANVANQKAQDALHNETIAKKQAEQRRVEAEHQAELALSRQLTAQAQSLRSQRTDSLPLSMLLAVESMKRSPSLEDDQLLRSGLSLLPAPLTRIPQGSGASVLAIARHPRENSLATACFLEKENKSQPKTSIRLWDLGSGRLIRDLNPIEGRIQTLLFSGDGNRLLGLTANYRLIIWNASDNWTARQFELKNSVPGSLGPNAVKIAPDGRFVAMRYSNHGAVVLSVDSQKLVKPAFWHPDSVIAMAFSDDGGWFASGSANGVWLWDLKSDKAPIAINQESPVLTLTFSHDSRFLAVGCQDRAIVWQTKNSTPIRVVEQGQFVYRLAFSANGHYLAVATMRGGIQVWDVSEWKLHSRTTQRGDVLALTFNPNNRELYSLDENQVIRVWDVNRNDREVARVAQVQGVNGFTYSLNGDSLITAGADSHVTVWQSSSQQEAAQFTRGILVRALAFSPDAQYFATAGVDRNLWLWNMPAGNELKHVALGYDSTDVIFSDDSQLLATFIRPEIRIFSVPALNPIRTISYSDGIRAIKFSASGKYIVGATSSHEVLIWDVATGGIVKRFPHGEDITAFASSTRDKYLAAAGEKGTVRVWKLDSGQETVLQSNSPVKSLRFSQSGRYVGISYEAKKAEVYDLRYRKVVATVVLDGQALDICFSPDERIFAVASADATARLYRANGGQEVTRLQHIRAVLSVAFSPDGRFLATKVLSRRNSQEVGLMEMIWWGMRSDSVEAPASLSDEDNALRIWNTNTWKETARLAHDSEITRFSFSPDSRYVATGSEQGARVFYLWPDDLIQASSKRLIQNLSENQWQEYMSPYPYKRTFPKLPMPRK